MHDFWPALRVPGRTLATLAALALATVSPVTAQDVEQLGRIHGTRPPQAYFDRIAADPDAYEFRRGWGMDEVLDLDPGRVFPGLTSPQRILGQREGGVEGTFRFPLILGLFADSPMPAFSMGQVHSNFFAGPSATGTIREFYAEMSGGKVDLIGETSDWVVSDLTRAEVTGGVSGLSNPGQVWKFIMGIVAELDNADAVDWELYDNDGPDGIPNSGDDDGYVDVLSILHPTRGAECSAGDPNLVWSHRWSVRAASGMDIVTTSLGISGNPIRIDDYTIQPLIDCDSGTTRINRIGVFAHELGHGFGLPDLYDTVDNSHAAAGEWDLMATGAWGCTGYTANPLGGPARPCHMGAWSKAILGWVDVINLSAGSEGSRTLKPVETSNEVYRIDALDGSGEYFLLENRQPIGFDGQIHGPGLLIWQIDPVTVESRWASNRVNSDRTRMGVRVRQADGLDDLSRDFGNRGDDGDPFPGSSGAMVFHAATVPSSRTFDGNTAGVTLQNVSQNGADIEFDFIAGYRTLTLVTAHPGQPTSPWQIGTTFSSTPGTQGLLAPFESAIVAAPAGFTSGPGVRDRFDSWTGLPVMRSFTFDSGTDDTVLEANFGPIRDFLLDVGPETVPLGFESGGVVLTPHIEDSWYTEGMFVQAEAIAAEGFIFEGWIGDLVGAPNPTFFDVSAPLVARATFLLDYDRDRLLAPFLLTSPSPSMTQAEYLDAVGNQNGRYDLGDLRSFILAREGGE